MRVRRDCTHMHAVLLAWSEEARLSQARGLEQMEEQARYIAGKSAKLENMRRRVSLSSMFGRWRRLQQAMSLSRNIYNTSVQHRCIFTTSFIANITVKTLSLHIRH
jgi:hypothetical protein